MKTLVTEKLTTDVAGITRAAELLTAGKLVAFPTETVYGLGADARNGSAVANIYDAKGRPSFNPLIVHVQNLETAQEYTVFDDLALSLAKAFWPGPMTLVLPLRPNGGLSSLVTAGLDTVAVRVPSSKAGQDLLNSFDGPVAAPSANISGSISATSARDVQKGLGGKIDAILNGGPCEVGLESTILKPDNGAVYLLRAGGLPLEDIKKVVGEVTVSETDPNTPSSPGQLLSHYAPNASLRMNVVTADTDEYHLGFGDISGHMTLSDTGNLIEAAANLFAFLRLADEDAATLGKSKLAVAPIPITGLGLAINDRLKRASAPRN